MVQLEMKFFVFPVQGISWGVLFVPKVRMLGHIPHI